MLRKNQGLSINTFMMEEAFGGSSSAGFNDAMRVPWYSLHKLLCNACYAATLCLFTTRLISRGRFPVTSAELYPLCYCVAQYLTILSATELAFTYDEFSAFPLAWSSGLILRELTQMRHGIPQRNVQNSSKAFGTRWICFGFAGIVVIIGTQCGLGVLCSYSGLGFLRPIPAEESVSEIGNGGISSFSDVHCALSLPPDQKQFKRDESFQTAFKVSSGSNDEKPLAFFVSGNQRSEAVGENVDWEKVPAKYSIRVDGREVVAGAVQDLANIRFVTVKVDNKREVLLEMELKYLSDFRPPSVQLRPAVAVEYIH
jgi:hypothetical protein